MRGPSAFFSSRSADGDRLPIGGALLLLFAVLIGGGHIEGPIRNGIIQSGAAVLLLILAWRQRRDSMLPSSALLPVILWLAILGVFLIFLIPLPPALLPGGREASDAVRALAGVPQRWRPLSLDPAATTRMAASLLVPIAMTLATLSAGPRGRSWLIRTLLVMAIASAFLGMVQLALGYPGWATPFGKSDPGVADGLFVNRNHQAMLMLAAIIATALLIRLEGSGSRSALRISIARRRVHLAWLLLPLFTVMTAASGSRAGIGLLLIVLPASIALGIGGKGRVQASAFPRWIVVLIVAALVAVLAFAVIPVESIATIRSRMVFNGDTRLDLLPDVLNLVGQHWPWGSGPGTFVPAYKGLEDLDKLGPAYFNHAHNEYLEWLSETGLIGLIVLIGAVGALLARLWIVLGSSRSDNRKALALGGAGIMLLLGVHSTIDYPMRTDAHAALFGLALGLLFTPALDPSDKTNAIASARSGRRWLMAGAVGILALAFAGRIMQLRLAEVAAGDADGALASIVGGGDGFAGAYAAEASLAAGNAADARRRALAAIDDTPLSVVAVRTLALAEGKLGHQAAARDAWRAAAGLGWRDVPTQYWAMRQSLADGENAIAGMRADAMLRMNQGVGPFADLTRSALRDPALRHALVARMALNPGWRQNFFYNGLPVSDGDLPGMVAALKELRATAAPPNRVEARATILGLLQRGRVTEAVEIDRWFASLRKRDPGSLIDDANFERAYADYQGPTTPFDWSLLGVSGNSAALDESTPRSMVVSTSGTRGLSGLRRFVALAPGRYRLDYRMRGAAEAPSSLGVWIGCGSTNTVIAQSSTDALASDAFEERSILFDVPPTCPAVQIHVGGVGTEEAEASFNGFKLSPAGALPSPSDRR